MRAILLLLMVTAACGSNGGNKFDLNKWDEVLRFDADTFARSFELLGADFCFGLGCDPELLKDSTGTILRLPASALEKSRGA